MKRIMVASPRRLFHLYRRPESVYETVTPGGAKAGGGGVIGRAVPPAGATLEEAVEYLLRRDADTQATFSTIERTIAEHPRQWSSSIESTRREVEARIERRLTETQERYLVARRLGLVFLLAGVACVAASNVLAS